MSRKYKTLKTQGNYNNHLGVPLTLLRLDDEEAAVIEMGMNHLGEISKLTKIAEPTISVITNIGTAHIGILGSRENILKAKLEILEGMRESGTLIIDNDNDLLHEWYLENKEKVNIMTYGIENSSDIMAENIVCEANSSTFDVKLNGKKYNFKINKGGKHLIINSLSAICVGIKNAISMEDIAKGISEFELTQNRMEVIEKENDIKVINDTYNASYDSMKAMLEYLKMQNAKRRIAILGDILEIGEYGEEIHKKVGEEVYKNNIDILITVGKNAKYIGEGALNLGMPKNNVFSYETNSKALGKIKELMKSGDCILVKASYGMKFKEIIENI